MFLGGQIVEGQIIKKNNHFDSGKFKQGKIIQGIRVYLNVNNLPKDSKTLNGFVGEF